MAGHNKWSKVKHIKGPLDAKRGKLFSKLAREIALAAKEGGGDPGLNHQLRQAIASAKSQNMPGDTIDRAVRKGTGEIEGANYEEILYEGYGPNGVAMIVETVTDNKNRTAAEMRSIFSRNNGNLGSSGSVTYLFDRVGEIRLSLQQIDEEGLLEIALEAGADDVAREEDEHVVITSQDQLAAVADNLRSKDVELSSQKLIYVPQNTLPLTDESIASQVLRLYEKLEDCDDTINVFSNFDISEEILNQINS